MNIHIPYKVLEKTKAEALSKIRTHIQENARYQRGQETKLEYGIPSDLLNEEVLLEIQEIATSQGDKKTKDSVGALIQAKKGNTDIKIPNFKAAGCVILAYLKENAIKGWIFKRGEDGKLYPKLITKIVENEGHRDNSPRIQIHTSCYRQEQDDYRAHRLVLNESYISLVPSDVVRKKPSDALAQQNLFRETPELHAEYEADLLEHQEKVVGCFGKQYLLNGPIICQVGDRYGKNQPLYGIKVVHNLPKDEVPTCFAETAILETTGQDNSPTAKGKKSSHEESGYGTSEIPVHPVMKVFDLRKHVEYWVHSSALTPYVYKPELKKKLVLTDSHKDMLDILTSDPELFLADSIEGKGSGNIILCKGKPGIGKTLTPEIYSEVIEKPLLPVHSGILGTDPGTIEKKLMEVFELAERWEAVLLIDEADIFVSRRNNNLEHNAIVAVFLRILEYFKGLFFMTTNRPDDIDEAILSRCAAIIHYPSVLPQEKLLEVWKVLSSNHKIELPETLLTHLITSYPSITPRDVRMLLRLALKVANHQKVKVPTPEIFRQCAIFRALTPENPTE